MSRQEIVIGGFGGQGIILAGSIVGKAAAIFDGRDATLTQDYGPEARGGACRAQVVVSDSQISYPYVEEPEVLVVMSQEAYTKYSPGLRKNGLLLFDKDLVDGPVQVVEPNLDLDDLSYDGCAVHDVVSSLLL